LWKFRAIIYKNGVSTVKIQDKTVVKKQIAVIGAGTCNDNIPALAKRVGEEIAKREAFLLCGGLGGLWKRQHAKPEKKEELPLGFYQELYAKKQIPGSILLCLLEWGMPEMPL
jgi:hypothetical protein